MRSARSSSWAASIDDDVTSRRRVLLIWVQCFWFCTRVKKRIMCSSQAQNSITQLQVQYWTWFKNRFFWVYCPFEPHVTLNVIVWTFCISYLTMKILFSVTYHHSLLLVYNLVSVTFFAVSLRLATRIIVVFKLFLLLLVLSSLFWSDVTMLW